MSAKPRIIHPLNIPAELDAKLTDASEKMNRTKAETMRMAMEIGLRRLAIYNFDPYEAVAVGDPAPPALKVAEPPMGNESARSTRANSVTYPKAARRKNG